MYGTQPLEMCAHVKDPISVCRKIKIKNRPDSRWYGSTKALDTQEKEEEEKKLRSAVLWLLAFPGEKQPEFPQCGRVSGKVVPVSRAGCAPSGVSGTWRRRHFSQKPAPRASAAALLASLASSLTSPSITRGPPWSGLETLCVYLYP